MGMAMGVIIHSRSGARPHRLVDMMAVMVRFPQIFE
jgi:hypothetical protein